MAVWSSRRRRSTDFKYTPEGEKFRKLVRAWFAKHRPRGAARLPVSGTLDDDSEWARLLAWHERLHDGGWIGLAWPSEYGGRGATLMEQIIFNQELGRRKLPSGCNALGVMRAGPAIMHWGAEEQKQRHQARKLNGLRSLTKRLKGAAPGPEGSIGKLAATERTKRMARFAVELAGPDALIEGGSPFALDRGRWLQAVFSSPALTIAGGTSG